MKLLLLLLSLFSLNCIAQKVPTGITNCWDYSSLPVHRKHRLGMTFTTYPPFYSCAYCMHECSPYQFLPKAYEEMRIPMIIVEKDTLFWNGYGVFCDSLKKLHQNEDSFFLAKWNEVDTSCLSNEIALNKSRNIEDHWIKTHKTGRYWLDKESCMSLIDGNFFINQYDSTGKFTMGYGGRYNDSTLLTDKWYKIDLDKPKKKKS